MRRCLGSRKPSSQLLISFRSRRRCRIEAQTIVRPSHRLTGAMRTPTCSALRAWTRPAPSGMFRCGMVECFFETARLAHRLSLVARSWQRQTQQPKTQLIAHDKEVFDIAFSAQNRDVFASVGADGSVRMFDLRYAFNLPSCISEVCSYRSLHRSFRTTQEPGALYDFVRVTGSVAAAAGRLEYAGLQLSGDHPHSIPTHRHSGRQVRAISKRRMPSARCICSLVAFQCLFAECPRFR